MPEGTCGLSTDNYNYINKLTSNNKMSKKLLKTMRVLLVSIGLVGGVGNAWATVTATLSGMNKVGDYYYPVYTLSESSTISSFRNCN